ncbi:hypothetical protein F7734_31430 [Scytonema sp. UIC 10036]|uniref:beta strand repeat-containing protein n=1 Tax=Scytonema sp. UIC 10036 TaxID=2304196 RepID=UPI0012DAA69C|nr:S-layer family protein [Scytonema sp. UIC 10036]MUG96606.1 hypothetical protein [Scytonema sp. UIC 10036]
MNAKQRVSLDGQSSVFSNVFNTGTGNGGDIRINTETLFSNGSVITSNTNKKGNAGNVIIEAREQVSLDNRSVVASSVGSTGIGKGGDIYFSTGKLSLINNSILNSSTSGQGNAGNVIINAKEQVFLDGSSLVGSSVENTGIGQGGDIRLTTNSLSLTNGARLSARTNGQGNAGNIQISTFNDVSVSGTTSTGEFSSGLLTSTTNNSTGKGGDITVNTNVLRISNGAVFNARTSNNRNGGDITINTSLFEALNGGQLIATTSGEGSAGKITVNATDQAIVNGSDVTFNDRLAKFPGTISNIGATSGFFVLSSSSGSAGDIEVISPKVTLDNQGRFIASSASGDGGNIALQVSDLLLLRRNSQISTNAGTELKGGNGGNINVNSKYIVAVPEEDSDLTANAYTGAGGQVQINSQGIFGIEVRSRDTNRSDITASSELGVAGVTNINSPDTSSLRNSLNQLPENIIDTNALIANSCIARRNNRQSGTFLITGGGGLPERPGNALLSPYVTGTMRSVPIENESPTTTNQSRTWKIGDPIIEPQGFYQLANGKLVLSRECP